VLFTWLKNRLKVTKVPFGWLKGHNKNESKGMGMMVW